MKKLLTVCLLAFAAAGATGCRSAAEGVKPKLMWLDCSALGFNTQADLTRFFLEEAKVAMNPGESFGPGGKNHMRLNTACPRSILEEALSRIEAAADKRMAELAAK